jgi:hypothetical protein
MAPRPNSQPVTGKKEEFRKESFVLEDLNTNLGNFYMDTWVRMRHANGSEDPTRKQGLPIV